MRFDVPDAIMALAFPTGATSEGLAEPGGRRGNGVRASRPRRTRPCPGTRRGGRRLFREKGANISPPPHPVGGNTKSLVARGLFPAFPPGFFGFGEVFPVPVWMPGSSSDASFEGAGA